MEPAVLCGHYQKCYLPYQIDKLPFFTVCKKAIRCNFGEKFSQERDGKKPYCIYPANDLKLQK